VTFLFAAVFLQEKSFLPKWIEQSSSAGTTFITFPNTVRPYGWRRDCSCWAYALDRYEKRHKNLAAHLSPAFRVELGDVVTVGRLEWTPLMEVANWTCRSMPPLVEDCALQRVASGQEQGCLQNIQQVLDVGLVYCCRNICLVVFPCTYFFYATWFIW